MRIMLLTSFSGYVDLETHKVNDEHRESVQKIIDALRSVGFTVFSAVEHEGWIISSEAPEVGVMKDLAEIDSSDIVLALLPTGLISAGLQYEMGYADRTGKKVIAATEQGSELGYFNQGLVNLGRIRHIQYTDPLSLSEQVKAAQQI